MYIYKFVTSFFQKNPVFSLPNGLVFRYIFPVFVSRVRTNPVSVWKINTGFILFFCSFFSNFSSFCSFCFVSWVVWLFGKQKRMHNYIHIEAVIMNYCGFSIILDRDVDKVFVNSYNPVWILAWNGNPDIQVWYPVYLDFLHW